MKINIARMTRIVKKLKILRIFIFLSNTKKSSERMNDTLPIQGGSCCPVILNYYTLYSTLNPVFLPVGF